MLQGHIFYVLILYHVIIKRTCLPNLASRMRGPGVDYIIMIILVREPQSLRSLTDHDIKMVISQFIIYCYKVIVRSAHMANRAQTS